MPWADNDEKQWQAMTKKREDCNKEVEGGIMKKIFAIGDIHGCLKELRLLIEKFSSST